MKKILLTWLIFIALGNSFAQESNDSCILKEQKKSPAIQKYEQSLKKYLTQLEQIASTANCNVQGDPQPIVLGSIIDTLNSLDASTDDIDSFMSDIRYYHDSNQTMILKEIYDHEENILELISDIYLSAGKIAQGCGQGLSIEKNFEDSGRYISQGKNVGNVLTDMYSQTNHVLVFFRNLVRDISDREYSDNANFLIADTNFTKDMREFYSIENLQKCYEIEKKNMHLKDKLEGSLINSWKNPLSVYLWRDIYLEILFPSKEYTKRNEEKPYIFTENEEKIQSDIGGLSNSRISGNTQFFREFHWRGHVQSFFELIRYISHRTAFEDVGALVAQKFFPEFLKENPTRLVPIGNFIPTEDRQKNLAQIERDIYSGYAERKILVAQNKQEDVKTITPLVRSIEELLIVRPHVEELLKLMCQVYNKQATNYPEKPSCDDLLNAEQ